MPRDSRDSNFIKMATPSLGPPVLDENLKQLGLPSRMAVHFAIFELSHRSDLVEQIVQIRVADLVGPREVLRLPRQFCAQAHLIGRLSCTGGPVADLADPIPLFSITSMVRSLGFPIISLVRASLPGHLDFRIDPLVQDWRRIRSAGAQGCVGRRRTPRRAVIGVVR